MAEPYITGRRLVHGGLTWRLSGWHTHADGHASRYWLRDGAAPDLLSKSPKAADARPWQWTAWWPDETRMGAGSGNVDAANCEHAKDRVDGILRVSVTWST